MVSPRHPQPHRPDPGLGGIERDVSFAEAAPDVEGDIDAAYHAKYDRYGPRIVGSVTGPSAHGLTVRLVPQPGKEK